MSRILGIDYGEKRIGLALGDETQKLSLPYDTLQNKEGIIGELRRLIEAESIYRLVVGVPRNMSGGDTKKTAEVHEFIDLLERNFNMPVIREDERLTSKMADSLFREYGQKYDRDAISAMIILQGYLDKTG